MIRSLPIILLALGLVLALASLSRAAVPSVVSETPERICLEMTADAELVAPSPSPNRAMCWKKKKTGVLSTACSPEPLLLPSIAETNPQRFERPCLEYPSFRMGDIAPLLNLPPPRR